MMISRKYKQDQIIHGCRSRWKEAQVRHRMRAVSDSQEPRHRERKQSISIDGMVRMVVQVVECHFVSVCKDANERYGDEPRNHKRASYAFNQGTHHDFHTHPQGSIHCRNAHCHCILTWICFVFEENRPVPCLLRRRHIQFPGD